MRLKGKSVLVALAAAAFLAAPASAKERVAVLEFKNTSDLGAGDVDYLTDHVRGEIRRNLPRALYSVVTKENLELLLADQGIKLEDVCEGSCEIDVGRKIQVHLVVTGKILRMGRDIAVTLKIYNTKAGELLGSEEARGSDLSGAAADLRGAVARLVKSAVAPGAVSSGPSEAGVTELKPTALPTAAAGPAGLYITTEPAGAEVYLGEVRAGTAIGVRS